MSDSKNVILITGANSGIGFDAAAALAANPTNHVIITARSPEKGAAALAALQSRALPGALSLEQLDVTSEVSIANCAKAVALAHGRLDALVNNAGVAPLGAPLLQTYRDTFEANLVGPAMVTEAFKPLLLKGTAKRVVFVSSGLGRLTDMNEYKIQHTPYRSSKAALNMVSECYRLELEPQGFKVQVLDPGYVVTNLTGEGQREQRVKNGALSSETSAATIVSLIDGKRDADIGKFIHKHGVYPW